jgi:AraC-like DNA-binding protein
MSGDSMLARLQALGPGARTVSFAKSGARLHAMVTSAGYDRCSDPTYDWHGLRRGDAPYVLLQHTIAGRGQLRFGRQRHALLPGRTMLLQFPHDNRYWLERGDSWEFFWLCLNGREVLRVWRDAMASSGPVCAFAPGAVERLAGLALSVMQGSSDTPARASAIAYTAAMEVADTLMPWGVQASAGRPEAVRRAVSLAQARRDQGSVAGRVDVAALAAAAGYSRYHFTRVFTESEGMSPARYLLQQKMDEAVAALRTSPSPIKTIALRCGFADPNYFSKVFRRTFGISPRVFRAMGMNGPDNILRNRQFARRR